MCHDLISCKGDDAACCCHVHVSNVHAWKCLSAASALRPRAVEGVASVGAADGGSASNLKRRICTVG